MAEAWNHVHRNIDAAFPQRRRVGVRVCRRYDVIVLPNDQSHDSSARDVIRKGERLKTARLAVEHRVACFGPPLLAPRRRIAAAANQHRHADTGHKVGNVVVLIGDTV